MRIGRDYVEALVTRMRREAHEVIPPQRKGAAAKAAELATSALEDYDTLANQLSEDQNGLLDGIVEYLLVASAFEQVVRPIPIDRNTANRQRRKKREAETKDLEKRVRRHLSEVLRLFPNRTNQELIKSTQGRDWGKRTPGRDLVKRMIKDVRKVLNIPASRGRPIKRTKKATLR